MEPDDLLCSRNARPQKALVGRAQWKINQPPSLKGNERAWTEHLFRSMRAVKGSLGHSSIWVNGVKRGLGLSVFSVRATPGLRGR
jgi:hypothetical protein